MTLEAMGAGRTARLAWLDVARGASMVLVVELHADYALGRVGGSDAWLHLANQLLVALRLPLFFLVSGLLGAGMVAGPLRDLLRRRVLLYLWLLVLWWWLQTWFEVGPGAGLGPAAMLDFFRPADSLAEVFLVGQDDRWFLLALALFFMMARLLRGLPVAAQAGLAAVLGLAGLLLLGSRLGVPALDRLYYFPYFALGVLGGARLRGVVPRLGRGPVVLALALGFVLAGGLLVRLGSRLDDRAMALLSLVALPLGLALAALLARHGGWPARTLALVGRNTLAIYILHPFLLRLACAVAPAPGDMPAVAETLLLAALVIGAGLGLGLLLARVPGLLSLPPLGWPMRWGVARWPVPRQG